jgi:hypothetical protein
MNLQLQQYLYHYLDFGCLYYMNHTNKVLLSGNAVRLILYSVWLNYSFVFIHCCSFFVCSINVIHFSCVRLFISFSCKRDIVLLY